MKKILLTSLAILFVISFGFAQKNKTQVFKWYTFEEAIKLNKKHPKKLFIDIYTDWCGWCKKMDASTFSDEIIKNYMKEHFYPVKLNAERKDTVVFNGNTYVNPNPNASRSSHQLAAALLQGRMSYPSFVILDEKLEILNTIMGYKSAKDLEPILHFFGEDAHEKLTYQKFIETFSGSFTQ
ncbi:MAG: DUF255 domain-containing protein [Bacteroidales bacterium]|jgi:thioredoxin-related protein|nr:DUF255 domain-containing protein [Bacteroidales bacterium]MDD4214708.1 DUF255 domain-containing protein [Bacteroidales bacterium]